jgi:predicted phage baseplate assembly protein
MPIVPPLLDDRTWKELRDEALARVPVYTPEWTDLRPGDPGVTLVEVFAYLTEALVYRLNRVPDNNYIAFLNLLDAPARPAEPSKALVQLAVNPADLGRVGINKGARFAAGKVPFTAEDSLTVLPVEVSAYVKCRTSAPRARSDAQAYAQSALRAFQQAQPTVVASAAHVVTRPYPPADGSSMSLARAVDSALWVAVMLREKDHAEAKAANKLAELRDQVRRQLGDQYLSLAVAPSAGARQACTSCEAPEDLGGNRATSTTVDTLWRWEITAPLGIPSSPTTLGWNQQPTYRPIELVDDRTRGLRQPGVIKLKLPGYAASAGPGVPRPEQRLATWDMVEPKPGANGSKPVPLAAYPRAGDLPPLLDDGDEESRVLFWLRALPIQSSASTPALSRPRVSRTLTWIGTNVLPVVQAVSQSGELVGKGTGQPGQQLALAFRPVVAGSLELSVREDGSDVAWKEVDRLDASSERDSVFLLDRAMGVITLGDGLKGRVLPDGALVYASYRYGGGLAGNVSPGAIDRLDSPVDAGASTADLDRGRIANPLAAEGGSETETVDQARRRVPMILRHQNRAVTAEDFRELAALTPQVAVGRAEVLPLYRPGTPASQKFPGVVSVLVVPAEDALHPRAPMPDEAFRREVCLHLDRHRLITTELYVIGPRYVPIAVAVGVQPRPGVGIEDLSNWVCLALYQYLAPLPPFGPDGKGWPLGGRITRAAIEAAVLQVEGVAWVENLTVQRIYGDGRLSDPLEILPLGIIELPELQKIAVGVGAAPALAPEPQTGDKVPVPVPVPRQSC